MNHVWIVETGEDCEGSVIRGVYSKEQDALDRVAAIVGGIGGTWRVTKTADATEWHEEGCEWHRVRRYSVR